MATKKKSRKKAAGRKKTSKASIAKKTTRKKKRARKIGPATIAKKTASKRANAKNAAERKRSKVPARRRRAAEGKKKGEPGKTKGASTICTEDLIEFIVHQFSQGRRPWMIREAVIDWVEKFHPERPNLPSRTTVDKAMAIARAKVREYTDHGDPEKVLIASVQHYEALAADPKSSDLVRLKARQALDELLGVGAKWTSTFLSPEAQAQRALIFLQQAQERRKLDEQSSEEKSNE